jgi:hypothetical protein
LCDGSLDGGGGNMCGQYVVVVVDAGKRSEKTLLQKFRVDNFKEPSRHKHFTFIPTSVLIQRRDDESVKNVIKTSGLFRCKTVFQARNWVRT